MTTPPEEQSTLQDEEVEAIVEEYRQYIKDNSIGDNSEREFFGQLLANRIRITLLKMKANSDRMETEQRTALIEGVESMKNLYAHTHKPIGCRTCERNDLLSQVQKKLLETPNT